MLAKGREPPKLTDLDGDGLAVLAAVKLEESDSADHQWMKELMKN